MTTSPKKLPTLNHDIPLANLFAYIRDLYHTSDPEYRFEEEGKSRKVRNQSWWSLADWQKLTDAGQIECQWESPDHPILSLHRVELPPLPPVPEDLQGWVSQSEVFGELPTLLPIREKRVPFNSQPSRVSAYRAFFQQVHDQPVEAVADLSVPEILNNWVAIHVQNGKACVELMEEGTEYFEEDDLRQELLTAYSRVYREHFEKHARAAWVNQLFDALHAAHFELKAYPEKRLFLSFGLLCGTLGNEAYRNFLFHIPLRLQINKQELSIYPDTFSQTIRCEQSFTDLLEQAFPHETAFQIDQRRQHVLGLVDQFHQEPNEFNLDAGYLRHSYYETGMKLLEIFPELEDRFFDKDALNWAYEGAMPDKGLRFSCSPIVHTRTVESHEHIAKDASRIIEKINELSSLGESERIPDFFKKLFSLRRPEHKLRIAYKTEDRSHLHEAVFSEETPGRLLFPLPSNREQRAIAERLAKQDAVTVMGPPGTGKSHTIANLTSHYVAQGKSVLIVSRYAKALEVIREKLPGGIRNLAVSFNQQAPQQEALKHAIDAIKENLSRPIDPRNIQALEDDLDRMETTYHELMTSILNWMGSHQEPITLQQPEVGTLSLLAVEWVRDYFQPAWEPASLHDPVPVDADLNQLAEDFERWTQAYPGQDLDLLSYTWPEPDQFPSVEVAQSLLDQKNRLQARVSQEAYEAFPADKLGQIVEEQLHNCHGDREWLKGQAAWMLQPDFDESTLGGLLRQLDRICAGWEEENKALLPYSFDLGPLDEGEWEDWQTESRRLWEKLNAGLNLVQKKLLSKPYKALMTCRVNGRLAENTELLGLVMRAIDQELRRKQWHIALNNYLAPQGVSVSPKEVEAWRRKLVVALTRYRNIRLLEQGMKTLGFPVGDLVADTTETGWAWLIAVPVYRRLVEAKDAWNAFLSNTDLPEHMHKTALDALQALQAENLAAYEARLAAWVVLRQRWQEVGGWEADRRTWTRMLPETTARYLEELQPVSAVSILTDVFHAQLRTVIEQRMKQSEESQSAMKRLTSLQKEIEEQIAELISLKTWARKQEEVSDEQKSALSAWRNDLINIGKGYGKNTERNMTSAVTNMQLAKGAVPIWIMQQDTAITFFPEVDPGAFDLLIVDEASQCDISMLNLIFRSKKCIIVGDENQTSVATQASLFPIDRTNQLLDQYLVSHPFKQQFNINNRTASIYTLSGVIYPHIVTLREHFRCRPELIGFSNKYVYDDQIVPLRTATDHRFGTPLEAHYVDDDPTDRRRSQLVRQAVQLIADLIEDYEHKHLDDLPTVGILTLDASHEEHREHMIRELARHPKIKKYRDELNLLVGTSREFQGDERDVMILTSTATHKYSEAGELRPPRAVLGEEMMRIYNVAISRARDKAILLHSSHPESVLKMNEACYRRRLIEYCGGEGLATPQVESTSCDLMQQARVRYGEWGAAMLHEWMQEHPQADFFVNLRIGPYRLDLAMVEEGKKTGLMLDGQQVLTDEASSILLEEQLTLGRAGWEIRRVSELAWSVQSRKVSGQNGREA